MPYKPVILNALDMGTAKEAVGTQARTETTTKLHEEYRKPQSLQLYVRLLHGGKYFYPETPLTPEDVRRIPQQPSIALNRLQSQWADLRQTITISVNSWAQNTAKATMRLVEHALPDAQRVLKKAFNGWGVTMVDGSLLLQKEVITSGFGGEFYKHFCGNNAEDGMANMAKQLIDTFAKEHKIGTTQHNITRMEQSILLVLDAMKDWLALFYGNRDMQEAFAACVKAELAVFANRLSKVSDTVLSASLGEKERSVLRTLVQLPPSDAEMPRESMDTEESAIPGEEMPEIAHVSAGTHEGLRASDLVDQETLLHTSSLFERADDDKGAVGASFVGDGSSDTDQGVIRDSVGESTLHKEQQAAVLSEKRAAYYAIRAQFLSIIASFRAGENSFDVDALSDLLGINPLRLVMKLNTISFSNPQGDSEGVDDIIRDSNFSKTLPIDFGLFTTQAFQDMIQTVSEVFKQLGISLTGKSDHILPGKGRDKLNEEEARRLVLDYAKRIPYGRLEESAYMVWAADMIALPTVPDQLYYLIAQDPRLLEIYNEVREKALLKELAKLGGEDSAVRRRSSMTDLLESEALGQRFIPPLSSFKGEEWVQ